MDSELQNTNSFGCFVSTLGIDYHISLTRMVFVCMSVVTKKFESAMLSHVQLPWVEEVLDVFVTNGSGAPSAIKVVFSKYGSGHDCS